MKTVSPDRPRLTVPVLFHPHLSPPVSSPSPFFYRPVSPPTALAFPQRSQTAKPSPNSYAQPLPPRSNGDSISNPLHSEHLSVAKPRWQPQIPTLTAPQRRQMETAPPNSYGQPPSPQPNGEAFPKRARPEGNKPSKPHNKQQKGLSCAITHRRGPQSSQINSAQAKFSSAGISSPCQRPEPEQLPAVPACWPQRLRW